MKKALETTKHPVKRGRLQRRAGINYADDARLTKAEMATARPMRDAPHEVLKALEHSRGRPLGRTKSTVTLSLDLDVIAELRDSGQGWQTRANQMLRKALHLPPRHKASARV